MPRPEKFIEIGRVAYAVSGPGKGKLCVIVDVIDQNKALVDGPLSDFPRQEYQINRLQITKLRIKIDHGQRAKLIKQAWKDARIDVQWSECVLAQKLRNKTLRNNLTDFDKFKVGYLKQVRNRLVRNVAQDLRKGDKIAKKITETKSTKGKKTKDKKETRVRLNHIQRNYYVKQEAIRRAKHAEQVKTFGSEENYKEFLKKEMPEKKRVYLNKLKATRKEEIAQLKETVAKCGENKRLRQQTLEKYTFNKSGNLRFNREGQIVLKADMTQDINVDTVSEHEELMKTKSRYVREVKAKKKEALRLSKKIRRKRKSAAKRKPWAKKVTA